MAEDCLLGSWGWEAASHEGNGEAPDTEGILSLGDWYPAAMRSVLESGGGVGPMLRIGRGLGSSLRGETSATVPAHESSPSLSADHGRVLPAYSADRKKMVHLTVEQMMDHWDRTPGLGLWLSICLACRRLRGLPSALHKPGLTFYVYNPSTWEVESGGSQVQGHPQLSIGFMPT